jgi:bifunctional non-homologous end joining protein LigD
MSAGEEAPIGAHWTYEVKLDGFRVEAVRIEDRVVLYSKQGKLLTSQFFQVALELEKLPADTVLDGELVALDDAGRGATVQPVTELSQRHGTPDVFRLRRSGS